MLRYQKDLDDTLNHIKPAFYASLSITIVLDILVLILMVCVVVAWRNEEEKKPTKWRSRFVCLLKCVRKCFTLPLFVVFMLLAWIISGVFLSAAVASSDFCVDPDYNALRVLQEEKDHLSPVVYDALGYYIKGCTGEYYTDTLDVFDVEMTAITVGTVALHELVNKTLTLDWNGLASTCGSSFIPTMVQELLNEFDLILHNVFNVTDTVQETIRCSTLNPIYSGVVYGGVCDDAVGGFVWIFNTALVIAIFSMVMVTLRVAYYEIQEEDEEDERHDDESDVDIEVDNDSDDDNDAWEDEENKKDATDESIP